LVECRPTLWDKTSTEYKDRTKKRNKWNEVFFYLEKNYEDKSAKEQQEIGKFIIYNNKIYIFFFFLIRAVAQSTEK
jgi:hypothetical protein